MYGLEHVKKTFFQVKREDSEDEDVSIEKGYEDGEENEDDVDIIECAPEQG